MRRQCVADRWRERPDPHGDLEEVLYFDRESPHRSMERVFCIQAVSLGGRNRQPRIDVVALKEADRVGIEPSMTTSTPELKTLSRWSGLRCSQIWSLMISR